MATNSRGAPTRSALAQSAKGLSTARAKRCTAFSGGVRTGAGAFHAVGLQGFSQVSPNALSSRTPCAARRLTPARALADESLEGEEGREEELPSLEDFLKGQEKEDEFLKDGWEVVYEHGSGPGAWEDDEDREAKSQPKGRGLPAELRYFDTAKVYLKSGDGGHGIVAFRREKFVPKGGPAGGNGGRGGHIYLVSDKNLNSLRTFRKSVHFKSGNGDRGGGSNMIGRSGKDIEVRVPPGTVVRGPEGEQLAELLYDGDRLLLVEGGKGGRGNAAFKSGKNNAPQMAENGEAGTEMWVELEYKVVADVGLVGCPNAGKSTLLSVVSAARPKVADYPFTTLTPNLGVCEQDFQSTVFADVPGLLEGAHEGVGLGMEFLRHCERCRMLVQVVDLNSPDPIGDYEAIKAELALFSTELASKPTIVALNKSDVAGEYVDLMREYFDDVGVEVYPISAVTGEGVQELVRKVRETLKALPPSEVEMAMSEAEERAKLGIVNAETRKEGRAPVVARKRGDIEDFAVEADLAVRVFYVKGVGIERFTQMTNWDYYESVKRFNRVLKVAGINKRLAAAGAKDGDTVVVGDHEFEFQAEMDEREMYQRWSALESRQVQGSRHWPNGPHDN